MVVQNYCKTITLSLGALLGVTGVLGMVLASSRVSAEDASVVDEINITVPIACTMSGTGMQSHNAEIANGIYTPDIGSTTLHAFCNDNEGFAIYAAGYTGNEVGGTNSNKLVGTTASGNATIESGIATTAGNPDTSNWAMKLTATQDSGDVAGTNAFTIDSAPNADLPSQAESGATQAPFSNYHVVPNEYTKVAHKNSGTDMTETTGGVKLTTTYAAYISKTQAADTYSGQVIYTLVHPSSHAAPTVPVTIDNITYMQDLASLSLEQTTSLKDSMTEEAQYQLIDSRDNKTYYVAKLKDGNIWMTQNLDLDLESTPTNVAPLTSENTDLPANTTWTPSTATYISSDTTWLASTTAPESYDPGDKYWNGIISDSWQNPSENYISTTGTPHYHLGNYYNWTAAVAMNDSSAYDTAGEIADQSICPAGWTLPRGGTGEDTFKALWDEYGFTTSSINGNDRLWTVPLYFNPGGYIVESLSNVGYVGNYWLSTVSDNYGGVHWGSFTPSTGGIDPNTIALKRVVGNSIRCLARPVTNIVEGL